MAIDHKKMDKYVNGKLVSKGEKDGSESQKMAWWKADENDMAKDIYATIKFIQTHQSTRVEQLTMDSRLYGNSSPFNFIGPALSRSASASINANNERITFNLCSSVIDTLVSKVAKNKIVPSFITSGGVWGMQKKAEQLTKFTEGLFYENKVHQKTVYAFKDASVWGTGILHIYGDEDQIKVERAFPHEFFVDQVEAMSAEPRQLHRVKIVDRDVMLAFAERLGEEEKEKAVEAVKNAEIAPFIDIGGVGTSADLVAVVESWHLKSSKDSDDGLHCITCGDTVIFKETYDKDYFPFAFLHYNKRQFGFWGQGACERLKSLQLEINRLMVLIQRSMWMGGSFKVLVETGSKVVSQHLNNDVGAIINYTGTPPQYVTPPMIQQDIYPYVDSLIQKGYQQEGVSQLSAASLKPMGLNSGAALRNYDQIGEDRFLFTMQLVEEFNLEVARQMIEVAKDLGSYKAKFPGTFTFEEIDWKDVKLKEYEYVLKAFPTSSLPDEPAGKLETVTEYMQAGLISPRAGRRLLAMPDVEMSDKLANAKENLLHKIFEDILDKGEYVPPEPQMDLMLAQELFQDYYNFALLNNCPDDKLNLIREFNDQVNDLIQASQPPPMPGPMPGAGPEGNAPMASPVPPPQNPMIPNIGA